MPGCSGKMKHELPPHIIGWAPCILFRKARRPTRLSWGRGPSAASLLQQAFLPYLRGSWRKPVLSAALRVPPLPALTWVWGPFAGQFFVFSGEGPESAWPLSGPGAATRNWLTERARSETVVWHALQLPPRCQGAAAALRLERGGRAAAARRGLRTVTGFQPPRSSSSQAAGPFGRPHSGLPFGATGRRPCDFWPPRAAQRGLLRGPKLGTDFGAVLRATSSDQNMDTKRGHNMATKRGPQSGQPDCRPSDHEAVVLCEGFWFGSGRSLPPFPRLWTCGQNSERAFGGGCPL